MIQVQTQAKAAAPALSHTQRGLLQRKCACGGTPGPSGECSECRRKRTQSGPAERKLPLLQTKLTLGQPGDRFEIEADRVAQQIMRGASAGPDARVQPMLMPKISQYTPGETPAVNRQPDENEEEERQLTTSDLLSMKEKSGGDHTLSPELTTQIQAMQGGGAALDAPTRYFMEDRFGHHFGQVRIHADTQSNQVARSLNARAFTVGRDIAFASGEYQPDTPAGKELLAHELTHVIQQGGGSHTIMRACDCSKVPGGRNPTASESTTISAAFPRLVSGDWCVFGPSTATYNCIAWSISNTSQWIWDQVDTYGDNNGTVSISDFDAFYQQTQGLQPQASPNSNTMVALFAKGSTPTHAALTSPLANSCGSVPFTSKLGRGPLVAHDLYQLEGGPVYGNIVRYYGS